MDEELTRQQKLDRVWQELDMMDCHGETNRPLERWNQLSPSEEAGEQEFKRE